MLTDPPKESLYANYMVQECDSYPLNPYHMYRNASDIQRGTYTQIIPMPSWLLYICFFIVASEVSDLIFMLIYFLY